MKLNKNLITLMTQVVKNYLNKLLNSQIYITSIINKIYKSTAVFRHIQNSCHDNMCQRGNQEQKLKM